VASVGHVAVGLAVARLYHHRQVPLVPVSTLAFWSWLSLTPDVDFIGLAFGVPIHSTWGHRGATHSFAFAIAAGLAVALFARWREWPARALGIAATLVVASHPILDAMTNHGPGCALFWPLDNARYLLPWRPLPTLPNFESLKTIVAWQIAAQEAALFAPVWLFALWPFVPRRTAS